MNTSSFRVDEKWSIGADRFGEIPGVACDVRGRVFCFARGPKPVLVFDREGELLTSWGEGEFVNPHGIHVGPDGTVYCTDTHDHTVRGFTPEGKLLLTLGTRGRSSDTGATSVDYRTIQRAGPPLSYPCNLALGPGGDLFVADGYGNARVHRFSADGRLLRSWGEPGTGRGQFQVVHGIAVDVEGIVYVADRENSRIQLFTEDGGWLGEWLDVARPCQVFIGAEGLVYVAELGFRAGRWPGTGEAKPGEAGGRVSIFDRRGTLLTRWGGGDMPCAPGDFFAPHDIWVDDRGDVYVSEVTLSGGGNAGMVPRTCHTLQKFVRVRGE